jgi:hypothetical protein
MSDVIDREFRRMCVIQLALLVVGIGSILALCYLAVNDRRQVWLLMPVPPVSIVALRLTPRLLVHRYKKLGILDQDWQP